MRVELPQNNHKIARKTECKLIRMFLPLFVALGALSFYGSSDVQDDIPGIGQYEDFHTIDWQRDIARDRMRHRYIVKKRQDSVWDLIKVRICLLAFVKIIFLSLPLIPGLY